MNIPFVIMIKSVEIGLNANDMIELNSKAGKGFTSYYKMTNPLSINPHLPTRQVGILFFPPKANNLVFY